MDMLVHLQSFIDDELTARLYVYIPCFVGLLIIWLIFKKSGGNQRVKYSEEEEEALINDWVPTPLVENQNPIELIERVVESKVGKYVNINGKICLNLASFSFLGFMESEDVEENVIKAIRKYGVGSCGPRGFYGTVDVHLELEKRLANFMEVEEAVVYSYGFSTIASAIPAYSKRGDIIFADEEVNYAIQKGIEASRSTVFFFKHNDMEDLERLLENQRILDLKDKKKAAKTRRFLIVEGIYLKTGKICCLPELIALRKKYKLRIFIDESISFGTLGKTGRGVTEHFSIPMIEVDLIMASMECALSSVGGFCAGSTFIVEHQRLSGLGYCFSASLPPLLAVAAMTSLDIIKNNPQAVAQLQDISSEFHFLLCKSEIIMNHFSVEGDPLSPLKHLFPNNHNLQFLQEFVAKCEERELVVIVAAFLNDEKKAVTPSIRINVNRLLTDVDLHSSITVFESVLISISQ